MAANWLPEQLEQTNTPHDDIQSLIWSVDISAYAEKLTPILANPTTKELLIKELKENQPISGGLMFRRIITSIELKIKKTEDNATVIEVNTTDVKNNTTDVKDLIEDSWFKVRMELAKTATTDVNKSFSAIAGSIWGELKSKISGEIDTKLQDINSGNISDETKSFLNQIWANTPESIASPEVQSILMAHISTRVYLENKDSILKTNPELGKQYDNLDRNKYALGVSGKIEAKDIWQIPTDIPKSDREAITSTVNSLTKWSPDTLVTRTGDRLTFSDPRNERYSYEIDMSKQPPRLAKTRNGLSISRDVVGLSPEQKEKKSAYETAKWKLDKWERGYTQWINEFWWARRDEYSLMGANMEQWEPGKEAKKEINIYSSIFLPENRSKQTQYEMIEQELANGNIRSEDRANKLNNMKQLTADIKSTNLSQMLATWETENHSKINTMLEQRYEKINRLQKSNQEIITAKAAVSKNPENTTNQYDAFDTTARDNLSWLVDNRFDRMWPRANDAIGQIIASINKDDPSTAIDLTEPMRQRDHDRLTDALKKLWGTDDVLTSGDRLPSFQNRINEALRYQSDNTDSIAGLLNKTKAPPSTK